MLRTYRKTYKGMNCGISSAISYTAAAFHLQSMKILKKKPVRRAVKKIFRKYSFHSIGMIVRATVVKDEFPKCCVAFKFCAALLS